MSSEGSHSFKAFTAAYRRPMAKVATAHDFPDLMISPKHNTESFAEGARKFQKDNQTLEIMLLHLVNEKEIYGENSLGSTVPFTAMMRVDALKHVDSDVSIGSIGGDVSGTSWSVTNHRIRQVMVLKMPSSLVEVIGQRSLLDVSDDTVRSQFMISVAEHLVLVFAVLQWGQSWKDTGILVIIYMADNQNSYIWTQKGFAG